MTQRNELLKHYQTARYALNRAHGVLLDHDDGIPDQDAWSDRTFALFVDVGTAFVALRKGTTPPAREA
jgi:hypothetical protein